MQLDITHNVPSYTTFLGAEPLEEALASARILAEQES
jgi:hypothetical protein